MLLVAWGAASASQSVTPVYVTASFVDRNHLYIEDLEEGEVTIRENGEPRTIEFMAKAQLPVAYALLFNLSFLGEFPEDERRGTLRFSGASNARNLAYELIDKTLRGQAIWVGAYEQGAGTAMAFTLDGFAAKQAIQQLQGRRRPADSFLYAGIFSAVQALNQRHEKRRVLIVFLNLMDTGTSGRLPQLKNLLSASNVELFVVSFASRMESLPGYMPARLSEAALRELAHTTAGEAFFTANYGDHLEDLTRRLHNHIRTFYTFGFQSTGSRERPAELNIECSRPGSKVRSRSAAPRLP